VPFTQGTPAQSVASTHAWPVMQGPQVPPQSTSVSVPFFTPSLQVDPEVHAEHEPPQSTPVSVSFFTPSLQVAAAHRCKEQTPEPQSESLRHTASVVHAGQYAPPQSIAVSCPSMRPSAHEVGRHFAD
jgi:hypothetical protein